MANEPRNHHYIPQCYLRGFGWKHKKQWYTNVAFGKKGQWHATNIRNVGAERDFLRVEAAKSRIKSREQKRKQDPAGKEAPPDEPF